MRIKYKGRLMTILAYRCLMNDERRNPNNSLRETCHKGHPMSGDNVRTYFYPDFIKRVCVQCKRERDKRDWAQEIRVRYAQARP